MDKILDILKNAANITCTIQSKLSGSGLKSKMTFGDFQINHKGDAVQITNEENSLEFRFLTVQDYRIEIMDDTYITLTYRTERITIKIKNEP